MKTDFQIQRDVMEELKWEPLLNASEIGVAAKNWSSNTFRKCEQLCKKM